MAVAYILTKAIIEEGITRLDNDPVGGFVRYFGVGILSNIGTTLGLVFLIVPGVILIVRWLPAYGFALVDKEGAATALERSWQETSKCWRPLFGAILLPLALNISAIVIAAMSLDKTSAIRLAPSFLSHFLGSVGSMLWTAIGLASFSLIRVSRQDLQEVFA